MVNDLKFFRAAALLEDSKNFLQGSMLKPQEFDQAPADDYLDQHGQIDTASLFSSVLLIEDEPAHVALISRALRSIVGEITAVGTADAAMRALESSYFELVLCDLNLPDASGIEVVRAIRRALPSLPIIILTSSNNLDDAVSAMREGAWEFMVKQASTDLNHRFKLVIERVAERKLQHARELKLRAERDAFWVAVQTAQDGLAIIGTGGNLVFSSPVFQGFTKLLVPDRAMIGGSIVALIERADAGVAAALDRQLKDPGRDTLWSSELQIKGPPGKSGRPEWVKSFEITLGSVTLGGEQTDTLNRMGIPVLRHFVMWVRDITRRKDQERFQRDLLSTTSHDLKGPLGAILTSAELLEETGSAGTSMYHDLLTRIASCARNSINIIDELLSARRIQDGVFVINPRSYDVSEMVEDIVMDYLPLAKAKNIKFSYSNPQDHHQIFADKLGLVRVLGNLVSNAIKFTPKEGSVTLATEKIGSAVRISVADSGPGIGPNERHALFERYSRLEKHSEVEGTGLGLYVTKNIIDAHNGKIEILSEVGKGTTFVISFPDPIAAEAPPQPSSSITAGPASVASDPDKE